MQIEASNLRLADAVRLAGGGEAEIRRIEKNGDVRVWFRGDKERTQPSLIYPLAEVVEIQRPGDLFAAPKPPKTTAEAKERIVERLTALGWTQGKIDPWLTYFNVTDPTDTVRVQLKAQAIHLQDRELSSKGNWTWSKQTETLGSSRQFATKLDDNIAWLLRHTRERVAERGEIERKRIEAATPPDVSSASASEPVVLHYSRSQGVLLGGATKANKDRIKSVETPVRFRYSPNLPEGYAWYVPRTRHKPQSRERIEAIAAVLRARGVPLTVDYIDDSAAIASNRAPSRDSKAQAESKPTPGRRPDPERRAAKLRTLADKLETKAKTELEADRLENTPKRAREAAHMRKRARRQIAAAQTLRRAADTVESGEFEYIARVDTGSQIDALEAALKRASWDRDRDLGRSVEERDPEIEDIDYAVFRRPTTERATATELLEASDGLTGLGSERSRLRTLSKSRSDSVELDDNDLDAFRAVVRAIGRDKTRKLPYRAELLTGTLKERDRLVRLGVHDTNTLRAALREYMTCCRGIVKVAAEDPIAAKKRELQFAKLPGYFPTPRPLAETLVDVAEIKPGMRVLEPSAGSGAIAEVIRERHPNVRLDLVEKNYTLREILNAEGFNLVGHDFTNFVAQVPYDRIIMNPPFEKRQDVAHIEHALELLRPGGRLVAIAAGGLESRDDKASQRLRERIEELGGRIEPLPAGSFKESGTNVNTVMIVVDEGPAKRAVTPAPAPEPKPAPAPAPEPKPAAAKPKPETEPKAETKVYRPEIFEKWRAHSPTQFSWDERWKNIPKTPCFVREDDGVTVTLCPAILRRTIGACPPTDAALKSGAKQIVLCQVDEEVEYFPGKDAGRDAAIAESTNWLVRGRRRRSKARGDASTVPSPEDFDAQERYLDALVPTRIVYSSKSPLAAIRVELAPPAIVFPNGERQSILNWYDPIPANATLEVRVKAGSEYSLADFEKRLGKELIPYLGCVAPATIEKIIGLIPDPDRRELVKAGLTLHDVQYGRVAGHSVYWVRSADGTRTYGPATATGKLIRAQSVLRQFSALHPQDAQPLPDLPAGWTLDNTIVIALLVRGRRVWSAWQPSTELLRTKGEGDDWTEPSKLPRRAQWDPEKVYPDAVHTIAWTLLGQLDNAPSSVRFRVAGPWLGVVFPSDYGQRVQFDPPTGGKLDVEELEQAYADYLERLAARENDRPLRIDRALQTWAKLGPRRIKWARSWQRQQATEQRTAARAAKADERRKRKERNMSAKKKTSKKKKTGSKKAKSGKQFRLSARRRSALSVAQVAWLREPGTPTNYNGAKEVNTAKGLIEAGYLVETSRGTFAGQSELYAKLTEKGRALVLDTFGPFSDEDRAKLMDPGPGAKAKSGASKPKKSDAKPKKSDAKPKKSSAKPKKSSAKPKKSSAKPKKSDAKPKKSDAKPKAAKKPTSKPTTKKPDAKSKAAKKPTSKPKAAKKSSAKAKTSDNKPKAATSKPKAADSKPKAAASEPNDKPKRRLRFKRNDVVRFRKRSQIAKGLGVRPETEYIVEMEAIHNGRPVVVLRYGEGKHSALMKVPPGHLALVRSGDEIPPEIKLCVAKLSRFEGPISEKTRRLLAEVARRA